MLVLCLVVPAGSPWPKDKPAQENPRHPENPLSTLNKMAYTRVKGILARSAENAAGDTALSRGTRARYGRSSDIADAQYMFCSYALGRKARLWTSSTPNLQKRSHRRAQCCLRLLRQGLRHHDDASAVQIIKLFGADARGSAR